MDGRRHTGRVLLAMSGNRRYLTILVSDISGSSRHAERLEAEEYADLLDRFRQYARTVIPRHGGSIARLQGDGLLALFGHIEEREDDGRRAAEAAMELHTAVKGLRAGAGPNEVSLELHSGIHAGLVLVVEGDIERGRVDVVGEVVNTAARLCEAAPVGEIFVSEETLGPLAHFFEISAPRRMPIRGRKSELDVVRIHGQAGVKRRIDASARRGTVPFFGRADVLATLFDAAARANHGESLALLVVGEPGIGKTRLIEECGRRLDETRFRVLSGFCENYLGAEPLQPFVQVLRVALGWRPGKVAEENEAAVTQSLRSLPELPETLSGELLLDLIGVCPRDVPLNAQARVAAIVEFLASLARSATLVLFLDDWQWADDASRLALENLRQRGLPMLFLLAARTGTDDESLLAAALSVRLEPLEFDEAEAAIISWLPGADPFLTREIFRQSGGSPLFIEELCHAAAAGGSIAATPQAADVAWVSSLVASRLARLPDQEAECLRRASIVGNVFATWIVERLTDGDDAHRLLDALVAKDFLVVAGQSGMLRFKHVVTRDAVYATVDKAHRSLLHLQVAGMLQAEAGPDDAFESLEGLSFHYDAAGRREEAAKFAEAAGDKALAAMALDRARVQYTVALCSLDALEQPLPREMRLRWCSIAERLGQTCVFDPLDVAGGLAFFERAAAIARDANEPNAHARAEYWLAYVNYGKGRPREAIRHAELALERAAASQDSRLVAQVRATLGQALASAGRYTEAMPLFAQAVESKRQQSRPGSRTAIGSAYTLGRMGYTFGDLGRFDEAQTAFAESLHLLGTTVHSVAASVRELMCAVHVWQGRWDDAEAAGLQGADIALRCRSRYLIAMGRALAACATWARDEDEASLKRLRDATYWIESKGGAASTSLNYGWLVEATTRLGLEKEARRHAAALFQRVRFQDRHGQAQGCRALARAAAGRGDFARARHYLAQADRAATFRSSPREHAVNNFARAEISLAHGRAAESRASLETALAAFESMKMHWHVGRARELARTL